jgi:hypothetical protein
MNLFHALVCHKAIYRVVAAFFFFVLVAPAAAEEDVAEFAWPKEVTSDKGTITIYQPQIESLVGQNMEARAAVQIQLTNEQEPMFGAFWFSSRLATDTDNRITYLENVKVTAAKFPTVEEQYLERLTAYLEQEIPKWEMEISMEDLLASIESDVIETASQDHLSTDPPEIIVRDHPSVLIMIDGEPRMKNLEGSDIQYVVNTPYFIIFDGRYYFMKGYRWWFTTSSLTGEWHETDSFPSAVQPIVAHVDEEERKRQEQAAADDPDAAAAAAEDGEPKLPSVIVRTSPASLIQTDGTPKFQSIEGTQLLYMENTEEDVIMDIASQQYYVLLAGRWYRSAKMESGDWAFVANDDLPEEFANIPPESDMASVLASVAGTQEAREAVLEGSIPQTAAVDRKTATVTVTYDGDPRFEECSDNGVAYATNTDKSVLLIEGKYYCCDDGVWFTGNAALGPWSVATEIPKQVQDIPPECPVYNVKYVYIYESTPEIVYVGYTPAYLGSYYYHGCVVYGTGYYYQPWYGAYYYPRPVTYGFNVHYNPWTGWGFSFGMSNGWLHVGIGYRPYGGWWGPAGYRHGYRHGYHHGYRHGYRNGARRGYAAGYRAGQQRPSHNVYNQRGSGVKHTGNKQSRPSTARAGTRPANKPAAKPSNKKNNVYADKNGNVHRKQGNDWQTKNKSGWSNSGSKNKGGSSPSNQKMENSSKNRQRGNQRTQQSRSQSSSRSRGGGRRR